MHPLTITQGLKLLEWMRRAPTYANFIPPGLHPTHRRRMLMLLGGAIRTLEPSTAQRELPTSTWELWNHPLRAAALLFVQHAIQAAIHLGRGAETLPTTYRILLERGYKRRAPATADDPR